MSEVIVVTSGKGGVGLATSSDGLHFKDRGCVIQPDEDYQMSGNKITVKTLDLNRDFTVIAAQLNAIVQENFS